MLQGSLDNFALDEVLALLASTHKTGHLRLSGDRGTGSLWVGDGELIGAEASNAAGDADYADVMFELLRFQSGNFSFIADEAPPRAGDPETIDDVVVAGQELIVEWRGIESVVPSLDHYLEPVASLPSEQVMLTNAEWQTIQAIGEGDTVGEACRSLSEGELKGCRRIKGIVERGLVTITDPASAAAAAVAAAEAEAAEAEELAALAAESLQEPAEVDISTAPDAPVLDPVDLAASPEFESEERPPMPAPPAFGNTVGTTPPPPPAPPSPAEIESFSNSLTSTGDLSSTPPVPPAPPGLSGSSGDEVETEDPADDEASLLMRYLKSEG